MLRPYMIDFIRGLFDKLFEQKCDAFKDDWRFSSLDEVLIDLESTQLDQEKRPYLALKNDYKILQEKCYPAIGCAIERLAIDFTYPTKGKKLLTIKDVNPKQLAEIIRENFSENCCVIEKSIGRHLANKARVLRHYDIEEINESSRKKARVTKRAQKIGIINSHHLHEYREPYTF